jgi:biotin carboxyl carrier protein
MNIYLSLNGRRQRVELLSPAPQCRFRIEDRPVQDAQVESPEPGVYSILLDGRSYDAQVEETPNGLVVVIDGARFEAAMIDPRRWVRASGAAAGGGVQSIVAPMPGKVVRVLVASGDEVAIGQGIAVVEAMKMQNEMKAARAGRVLTLPAREGATVAAGEVLATIG